VIAFGAEMRRSLGLAVFSGMLGVTFFGIFLTPVFYYVISWFGEGKPPAAAEQVVRVEDRAAVVAPGATKER
jgi:hypothetical protein